jgi:hypothetical protein
VCEPVPYSAGNEVDRELAMRTGFVRSNGKESSEWRHYRY